MGLVSIVFLILFKKHFASLPGALLLVVVGITASYLLNFQDMSIPVVGVLPNILPNLVLPNLDLNIIKSLVLSAFVISIVGFMETFAVAKTIAAKTKEKIDADQEFMGQGLSNIFSGLFGGYTVAGSFSRSAVNFSAGAKTKVAGLVVAIVLVFSILFLTPLLYYLPKTILAAIVIVAVIPLIKFDTLKHIFHISRIDGMVAGVTFVFAFLLKPDEAVFIGMLLALFIFIRQVMFPQVSELGFDTEYNDILRRAGTKESIKTVPSVLVLRIDMSILYANVEVVMEKIRQLMNTKRENTGEFDTLILDFEGVNFLDYSCIEEFEHLLNELQAKNIGVAFIRAKRQQVDMLRKAFLDSYKIRFLHSIEELKTWKGINL
jgi:SulP family sulfate permease